MHKKGQREVQGGVAKLMGEEEERDEREDKKPTNCGVIR
jgi:hypothetical protein